ncbi:MAG: DUF503 domain-containing protein [Terriglobales bacterium]
MPVGVLQIEIVLPGAASLKDRRQVVRSLKDQLRRRFNVSIAELDKTHDLWQHAVIGIAAIGPDASYILSLLQQAGAAAESILAGQDVRCGTGEIVA